MNVCIILVDCLRADHLGCYGYPKASSPNIDSIASRGVVFENAVSQSNWTYPSLYSMMTGMYPSSVEISWWDQKVNEKFMVLPELLAGSGYRTGLMTSFKGLLNPTSFCSHFKEARQLKIKDGLPENLGGWVKAGRDSFLLMHIGEYVHEPFMADREYVRMFLDDDGLLGEAGNPIVDSLTSRTITSKNIRKVLAKINTKRARLSQRQVKYLLAAYDAGIYYTDKIVGELYNALRENSRDYLFILIADHGQAFMEHKVIGHGLTLYDELIRVPLIMEHNGRHSARVADPVMLMDLCPTIIDFAGLRPKSAMNGASLMPYFRGGKVAKRPCVSEGFPYIALRNDRYKLITKYSRLDNYRDIFNPVAKSWKRKLLTRFIHFLPDKLFDLSRDPAERDNLAGREKAVYASMMKEMNEIAGKFTLECLPALETGIDDEIKKQLEDLGYL
ncbi:MAG: sulfatase [Deltaproteobacteria bacterium]|nr:sulfatase [Deltaproteobacteria bacterium]